MPKKKKSASTLLRGEDVVDQLRSKPVDGPVKRADVLKSVGVKDKKKPNLAQRVVRAIGRGSPQSQGINLAERKLRKINEENKKKKSK